MLRIKNAGKLRLALIAVFALAGAFSAAGIASAIKQRPLCDVCRRYIDTSPAQCKVAIMGEKADKVLTGCSLFCVLEQLEDNKLEGEHLWLVTEYTSIEESVPLRMPPHRSHFLVNAECDEMLAHEPVCFYFRDLDDAKAVQEELGGELMEWEEYYDMCKELAEEWEPESEKRYEPLKRGDR